MQKIKPAAKNLFNFLALVLILFFSWFLGKASHINTDYLHNLLFKFPLVYSGLIYIILYVVLSFFIWFAKDILRATAALLFGAYLSTLFVYLSEMINAAILFNLSRFLGRDFVGRYCKGNVLNFDKKIERIGFFWILQPV